MGWNGMNGRGWDQEVVGIGQVGEKDFLNSRISNGYNDLVNILRR